MKRESGLNPELYPQLYALKKLFELQVTVRSSTDGKASKRRRARIPAVIRYDYFLLSGESSKIEPQFIVIHFLFLRKLAI